MKSKILMLSTLLLLAVGTALGQTINVKGVVHDENGEPMIGATVRVKNDGTNGAQTNFDGEFKLPKAVQQGAIIIISNVGYKTQELPAAANMTVKMVPDAEILEDVVVVAYGTAKKQSLVGAQANVSAKQLENRPVTNITAALAGAAPGVQVTTTSGQPGASAGIMIRGFGSINASSAPLYVVDGAVFNGSISDISPADIQSVSLLKDAASTALYGSSAGNGVVLITTKNGSRARESKPTFNFTVNVGGSLLGQERYETVGTDDYVKLLWRQYYNTELYEYGEMPEQAAFWANYDMMGDMKYQPYAGIKTGVGLDQAALAKGEYVVKLGTPEEFGNLYLAPYLVTPEGNINPEVTGLLWGDDMDWQKELFRTGLRHEYVMNTGYSNDKLNSFLSLSYLGEEGYKKYTDFSRFSSRVNLSYNVTDWFKVGTNTSLVHSQVGSPKTPLGQGYSSDPFLFLSGIAPIYPIHVHNPETGEYELDAKGNKQYDYNPNRPYVGRFNPVFEQQIDRRLTVRDGVTTRTFAEFKLLEGLTFKTNFAYDLVRADSKIRYNNIMGDQPQGLLEAINRRDLTLTFNQLLEYNKDFDIHNLNVLVAHESYENRYNYNSATKENMFLLGVDEMSNFRLMSDITSYSDLYRKEGYFGRVNYGYGDKYNVSLSYRLDGSSRFAPDKRWGHFWAIGAGWNISNESFMQGTSNWLDFLKLRFSIGQTGNDNIGTWYAYQDLYSDASNYDVIGLRVNAVGNKDLRWEKQTSYDLALEFSLINRIRGTVEFFNKESDDLIFPFPIPNSTGITSINKNIGKVRNYGIEMDFNVNVLNSNDLRWDIQLNGTWMKNKIIRLPEENREKGIELAYNKYIEGGSLKDFYLREFVGVDPDTGRAMYKIDSEQYPDQADPKSDSFVGISNEGEKAAWTYNSDYALKHFCGSSIPTLYGGFGTTLAWKGVDFNLQFGYQLGGKVYDGGYAGYMGRVLNGGRTFHVDALNAWKEPGQKTDIPGLFAGAAGNYNNSVSDRYLTSASSLMLKTVSLGYNLPKSWMSSLGVSNIRLSVAGENLFLISARKGLNPMGNYSGLASNSSFGFAKTFTGSISVTF